MRVKALAAGVASIFVLATSAFADVQLTIQNGRVSLMAKDATVRQILTEWAKIGQTRIVNLERIPGGPVTLQLVNVPEQQALDVLLRSVSGYLAAPRSTAIANASVFDRIVVMPTSVPPVAAAPAPPPFQQPGRQFAAPSIEPPQVADDGDDGPATNVPVPSRGPATFTPFAPPQVVTPQQQAVPTSVPGVTGGVPAPAAQPPAPSRVPFGAPGGAPIGVSVPGMTVPVPQTQQPGQVPPVPPGTPQGRQPGN